MPKSSNDVVATRSEKEQQVLEEQIRDLFENKIVFNNLLGFKLPSFQEGSVKVEFAMRPELIGHYMYGRLHGGVISSVLDVSGGLAVMWAISEHHKQESAFQILNRFKPLATIDMRVDFMRPGIGESFVAHSKVSRLGKRIATTQSSLFNDEGVEVAAGNAAYILI